MSAESRFKTTLDQPPTEGQALRESAVRTAIRNAAGAIETTTIPGRYQSLALTALEEALMWSVKAVAEVRD